MVHPRRTARRAGAGLLAAGLSLALLAGCGGEESLDELDEQFLTSLTEAGVIAEDAGEKVRRDVLERAEEWCETLTDPETTRRDVAQALAAMLRDFDAESSQKGISLYGTAASTYCPEAAERLQ